MICAPTFDFTLEDNQQTNCTRILQCSVSMRSLGVTVTQE